MSSSPPDRLRVSTATGSPPLATVDFSSGGLLVRAPEPFQVGAVVHLHLSSPDGALSGTFALRCLHTHRTVDPDEAPAHLSALVFVHPLDEPTRLAMTRLVGPPLDGSSADTGRRRHLRLADPIN